jgi:signal transduction histidine kinase
MKKYTNYYVNSLVFAGLAAALLLLNACGRQAETQHSLIFPQKISEDSLNILLQHKSSLRDTDVYAAYEQLIAIHITAEPQKSMEYARQALDFALAKNDLYQIGTYYYRTGDVYYAGHNLDSSVYYLEKSIAVFDGIKHRVNDGDKKDIYSMQSGCYRIIGQINQMHGKYNLAVDSYLKSLELAEKINEETRVEKGYLVLASTYAQLTNFEQAELYFLKGEKLGRKLHDSLNLAVASMGLCNVYAQKKNYAQAMKYGQQADEILSAVPHAPAYYLMGVNNYMSKLYSDMRDYDRAFAYAQKAVAYGQQTNVPAYMAQASYTLAYCYLGQKKYSDAARTAAGILAIDTSNANLNLQLYETIAKANIGLGNTEKATEYFNKTIAGLRSTSNEKYQSSLSEMEVKYDTEKKNAQIAAMEKEKKFMTILGISMGIILLLAFVIFFSLWRLTKRKKQLAETQVKQLELEKKFVATQAVLDGETQERTRLAKDLHDGLGSMLTGTRLNLMELQKGATLNYESLQNFDKAMTLLDESIDEMRRVAHHLMPDSLSRYGLKAAIGDFCQNLSSKIEFDYFGQETRLDPNLAIMIYRSIHELANNALKYSGASQILVQIMQEPGRIAFTVQDNGCGFDTSAETRGTGLQNIKNRIASFGGNLEINSKIGAGTEINYELTMEN